MRAILPLKDVRLEDLPLVGGKAVSLARLMQNGFAVPDGLCVATAVYKDYVADGGLRERILMELNRKDERHLRWEEVWDSALRIRNMFLNRPLPAAMAAELADAVEARFGDAPVVVRSSAPAEDSGKTSFAGLHESYVNVVGVDAVLERIRRVWASLWSDAAILYRRELGLDAAASAMAVVIQEIVNGDCAGVAFSRSPVDPDSAVVEAVHGLNQGLVDGVIEPDRWVIDRTDGAVRTHTPARREQHVIPVKGGIATVSLPPERAGQPPLDNADVRRVFDLARRSETLYGRPQDVEWTLRGGDLFVLQSRPITTGSPPSPQDDRRQWDLSLRRSFDNLKALRPRVEAGIRDMIADADRMAAVDPASLADDELIGELSSRIDILKKWTDVYWADFIPFAHGIRLFGQVYNDAVQPADPYEFVALLQDSDMQGVQRNQMLADMAARIRRDPSLRSPLEKGELNAVDDELGEMLQDFINRFGALTHNAFRGAGTSREERVLATLLLRMADHPPAAPKASERDADALKNRFLGAFDAGEERDRAEEILELGRVSYRLRDDDNIYLGRIEDEVARAADEGRKRLSDAGRRVGEAVSTQEVLKALSDSTYVPPPPEASPEPPPTSDYRLKSRQLVGQPAGRGLAKGTARVIRSVGDLAAFQHGEILVCDAVDPTMTFVVPLAAAVVERRGGMLIHGAIIAREYGLPCVTGVPDATGMIETGDPVTVDGYLGIVTRG